MGDLRLEVFEMWMKVHHIQCNLSFKIFQTVLFLTKKCIYKSLRKMKNCKSCSGF